MEKLRTNVLKLLALTILISLILSSATVLIYNVSIKEDLISFLEAILVSMPVIAFMFYKNNSSTEHGLFFNSSGVTLLKDNKSYNCKWHELGVKVSFSVANTFYLIYLTIPELKTPYRLPIFYANEKNFLILLKKYAPKDHRINNIIK